MLQPYEVVRALFSLWLPVGNKRSSKRISCEKNWRFKALHTIECLKTHSILFLNLFLVNSLFKILTNNYDLLNYQGFGQYFLWDLKNSCWESSPTHPLRKTSTSSAREAATNAIQQQQQQNLLWKTFDTLPQLLWNILETPLKDP